MKHANMLLGCLFIAAIITAALAYAGAFKTPSLRKLNRLMGRPVNTVVNALGDGTHCDGKITKKADASHSYRHLLVKEGSDADHIAVCGASDKPLGLCYDQPEAAEDVVGLQLLGGAEGTVLMTGNEAIAAGADVYTAASGLTQDEPASAGTYWKVGRAVTACSAQYGQFEVDPCQPQKVTVIANASTLSQTQAAMVGGAIVIVLGS